VDLNASYSVTAKTIMPVYTGPKNMVSE